MATGISFFPTGLRRPLYTSPNSPAEKTRTTIGTRRKRSTKTSTVDSLMRRLSKENVNYSACVGHGWFDVLPGNERENSPLSSRLSVIHSFESSEAWVLMIGWVRKSHHLTLNSKLYVISADSDPSVIMTENYKLAVWHFQMSTNNKWGVRLFLSQPSSFMNSMRFNLNHELLFFHYLCNDPKWKWVSGQAFLDHESDLKPSQTPCLLSCVSFIHFFLYL